MSLIVGIKESTVLNNLFTFINLAVIAFAVIVGLTKVHEHNWAISLNEVTLFLKKDCIFCFEKFLLDKKFN